MSPRKQPGWRPGSLGWWSLQLQLLGGESPQPILAPAQPVPGTLPHWSQPTVDFNHVCKTAWQPRRTGVWLNTWGGSPARLAHKTDFGAVEGSKPGAGQCESTGPLTATLPARQDGCPGCKTAHPGLAWTVEPTGWAEGAADTWPGPLWVAQMQRHPKEQGQETTGKLEPTWRPCWQLPQ